MSDDQQQRERDERAPLLQNGHVDAGEGGDVKEMIKFDENDSGNPRSWSRSKKMTNVAIIAIMSGE